MNIKNNIKIIFILSFVFLFFGVNFALAEVKDGRTCTYKWSTCDYGAPFFIPCDGIFPDCRYPQKPCEVEDVCVVGSSIIIGNVNYATNGAIAGNCISTDDRIKNFCPDIENCNDITDATAKAACIDAVFSFYDDKMTDTLQADIDVKINEAGLDNQAANDAIEDCGMNLICIDAILSNLQENGEALVGSGASTIGNTALTVESISDLINSSSSDTGVVNTASNDVGNMLGKTPGPKVEVTFNPGASSQAGNTVSATAIPSFFNYGSDPKKLYFTWYLKRKDCTLTDSRYPDGTKLNAAGDLVNISADSDNGKLASCDLDGDSIITVNDWKIAAARINVAKGFDKASITYPDSFQGDMTDQSSGYTAIPAIHKEKSKESGINIGWKNGFLRDAGKLFRENEIDDVANCYVQAPKSGLTYELRKSEYDFSDNECPDNYHRACVSQKTASCEYLNPLFSQTDADAAAAAGEEYEIVKISKKDIDACATTSIRGAGDDENESSEVRCAIKDDAALKNFKASVSCTGNDEVALCVKDDDTENTKLINKNLKTLGVIVRTTDNDDMCKAVAKPDLDNPNYFLPEALFDESAEKCNYLHDGIVDGIRDDDDNVVVEAKPNLEPKCDFKKGANLCKHLFPQYLKEKVTIDGKEINLSDDASGDGKFTMDEKKFWGADPTKSSTTENGNDEERIVGFGVNTFEWMFSPGDQVGVVVEGDSTLPTDHADSSYKRMWAFSKGTCTALDNMEKKSTLNLENPEKNTRGFYLEGNKGILTAEVNLNNCLEENLLDPDVDGLAKLKVDLGASPENPTNDPNGNGDILTITSSASNLINAEGSLYEWSIYKSLDGSTSPIDTTRWSNITNPIMEGGSFASTDQKGLGKDNIAIKLNLKDIKNINESMSGSYNGTFYLKIKVKITGTAADGNQDAEGIVIVRVKNQENEMRVYDVIAASDGRVSLNKGLSNQSLERCTQDEEKNNCNVTKNQIVGLEVPMSSGNLSNFTWKVNGSELLCSPRISTSCTERGNKLFFPVIGNEGEAIDVIATAYDEEKKESITVSRHFIITGSALRIESADGNAWPKLLGYFKIAGFGGSCFQDGGAGCIADESTQVLQTNIGKIIKLKATGRSGFDWVIDGQIIPELQDKTLISIEVDKAVGDSYSVGLSTHLTPDYKTLKSNERVALYNNWRIAPTDIDEENQNASIQIDVVEVGAQGVANGKQTSFGASLITHLSEQIMFLVKISLTAVTLLLSAGLLFALIPESIFKESE